MKLLCLAVLFLVVATPTSPTFLHKKLFGGISFPGWRVVRGRNRVVGFPYPCVRGYGVLGHLGYLTRALRNDRVPEANDMMNHMAGYKLPAYFDLSLNILISIGRVISLFIDVILPGLGKLTFNLCSGITRIIVCSLGTPSFFGHKFLDRRPGFGSSGDNYLICRPNYGSKWGWRLFRKSYKTDILLRTYGIQRADLQWNLLIKKITKGRGVDYLPESHRYIALWIRELCGLATRDISRWNKNIMIELYIRISTIIGAYGRSCQPGLGLRIAQGLHVFIDSGFQQYGITGASEALKTITLNINKIKQGSLSDVVITFDGDYVDDDSQDDNSDAVAVKDDNYGDADGSAVSTITTDYDTPPRGIARLLTRILNYKFRVVSDVFSWIFRLSFGIRGLVEANLSGVGSLIPRMIAAIFKIGVCYNGCPGDRSICNKRWNLQYNVNADTSSALDVITQFGLLNIDTIVQGHIKTHTKGKGIGSVSGFRKIILQNYLDMSLILKNFQKINKDSICQSILKVTTITAAMANTHKKDSGKLITQLLPGAGQCLNKQGYTDTITSQVNNIEITIVNANGDTNFDFTKDTGDNVDLDNDNSGIDTGSTDNNNNNNNNDNNTSDNGGNNKGNDTGNNNNNNKGKDTSNNNNNNKGKDTSNNNNNNKGKDTSNNNDNNNNNNNNDNNTSDNGGNNKGNDTGNNNNNNKGKDTSNNNNNNKGKDTSNNNNNNKGKDTSNNNDNNNNNNNNDNNTSDNGENNKGNDTGNNNNNNKGKDTSNNNNNNKGKDTSNNNNNNKGKDTSNNNDNNNNNNNNDNNTSDNGENNKGNDTGNNNNNNKGKDTSNNNNNNKGKDTSNNNDNNNNNNNNDNNTSDNSGNNKGNDTGDNNGKNTGNNNGDNKGNDTGNNNDNNKGKDTSNNNNKNKGKDTTNNNDNNNNNNNNDNNTGDNGGNNKVNDTGDNNGKSTGDNNGKNSDDNNGNNSGSNNRDNTGSNTGDNNNTDDNNGSANVGVTVSGGGKTTVTIVNELKEFVNKVKTSDGQTAISAAFNIVTPGSFTGVLAFCVKISVAFASILNIFISGLGTLLSSVFGLLLRCSVCGADGSRNSDNFICQKTYLDIFGVTVSGSGYNAYARAFKLENPKNSYDIVLNSYIKAEGKPTKGSPKACFDQISILISLCAKGDGIGADDLPTLIEVMITMLCSFGNSWNAGLGEKIADNTVSACSNILVQNKYRALNTQKVYKITKDCNNDNAIWSRGVKTTVVEN